MLGENNRIAELRKEQGVTLQQVADELNVGNNTISRYETGDRFPNIKTWGELAKFFDVPLGYLMGVDDRRYSLKTRTKVEDLVYSRLEKDKHFLPPLDVDFEDLTAEYATNLHNVTKRIKGINLDDDQLVEAFKNYAIENHLALIPTDKGSIDFFISKLNNAMNFAQNEIMEAREKHAGDFLDDKVQIDIFETEREILKNLDSLKKKYSNADTHSN